LVVGLLTINPPNIPTSAHKMQAMIAMSATWGMVKPRRRFVLEGDIQISFVVRMRGGMRLLEVLYLCPATGGDLLSSTKGLAKLIYIIAQN